MKQELRQTLKLVQQQVTEATEGYEWDEQAEFFGELADWAYGRHEFCLHHRKWKCRTTKKNTMFNSKSKDNGT